MKIAIAQIESVKGNISKNIHKHLYWIDQAIEQRADLIAFPELSLTGYEPSLAEQLALDPFDPRLSVFQQKSTQYKLHIGMGAPTKSKAGVLISLLFFRPQSPRECYSKHYLHPDEEPYFVKGERPPFLATGKKEIGLAICYEIFVDAHRKKIKSRALAAYLASVAKHHIGVAAAHKELSSFAKTSQLPVFFCNSVGPSDNFVSAGNSAIWNSHGKQVAQLSQEKEGLLVMDIP